MNNDEKRNVVLDVLCFAQHVTSDNPTKEDFKLLWDLHDKLRSRNTMSDEEFDREISRAIVLVFSEVRGSQFGYKF